MKVKSSKTGAFVFGRIDDCDEFCYNAYISIRFGFGQKQFNRSHTVSFAFSQMALFLFSVLILGISWQSFGDAGFCYIREYRGYQGGISVKKRNENVL